MTKQNFVDLSWIYIFATANYHVGFTVDNEEKTVCVAIPDVTRVEPSVPKSTFGGLGIPVIALKNIFTAQDDLAQFSRLDGMVIVVKNHHFVADGQAA